MAESRPGVPVWQGGADIAAEFTFHAQHVDFEELTAVAGIQPTKTRGPADKRRPELPDGWEYRRSLRGCDSTRGLLDELCDLFTPPAAALAQYCAANSVESLLTVYVHSPAKQMPELYFSEWVIALCGALNAGIDADIYAYLDDEPDEDDWEPVARTRMCVEFDPCREVGELERITGMPLTWEQGKAVFEGAWSAALVTDEFFTQRLAPLESRAAAVRDFCTDHGMTIHVRVETRSKDDWNPMAGGPGSRGVAIMASLGASLSYDMRFGEDITSPL
ncbi:MAG: DUF4279 domain-containing protein [Propionibacteriaceae bacterium]|jgi:hypothetical protein|nr:DUF4279 domain-containing protein [Propionibacteriaceae bacterium]